MTFLFDLKEKRPKREMDLQLEHPSISVEGKNDVYFARTTDLVASGRGITKIDIESKNKVCLIGSNIAKRIILGPPWNWLYFNC
ncbi:ABC transporter permease [Peribacillus glennii]|uniref:Uncharacterized protein n=1 Tax=Peribacillus glennii TaxID=2303991 RepID=A0A372L8L1_9BACI|nr:ABC transporter permease [Peribacillus glennii]RFU61782.1 hypothetical protein D0466_16720 [Peribacillus glennii]